MGYSRRKFVHLSVVIPLYNKREYIGRALASVAKQTYPASEVIVIDDGSTDDGAEIVERYTGLPVRLIRQRNKGVSAARNAGINAASGEWVAFLDADDEYHSDFLAQIAEAVLRYPDVGVAYGWSYFLESSESTVPGKAQAHPLLLDDYLAYVVFGGGREVNSSSVAIRRDAFAKAGAFPEGVCVGEDSDLWIRLAWTTRFVVIPTWLSTYHTYAGDSNWSKHIGEDAHWLSTYYAWKKNKRIPKRLVRSTEAYVAYYFLSRALYFVTRGERVKALRVLTTRVNYRMAPSLFVLKVVAHLVLPIGPLRRAFRQSGFVAIKQIKRSG